MKKGRFLNYVVTNGTQYMSYSTGGKINKTSSKRKAQQFSSSEEARAVLNKATRKLKNFYIMSLNEDAAMDIRTMSKRRRFEPAERKVIYAKSKGRCVLCGRFMGVDEFTVDHIIPLSKGGTNDLDNMQATCRVCNSIKQDILPRDFMEKISEIFLYQMRIRFNIDTWKHLCFLHRRYVSKKIRAVMKLF